MKELVAALGKGLALLAVGAFSGVLAVAARRKREPQQLVVRVWSQKPGESSVIAQTLVQKIDGGWVNQDEGYTVHELRVRKD